MTTGSKILIGGAVVIGGIVAYKLATNQPLIPKPATTTNKAAGGGTLGGFLDLTSSLVGYFTKNNPSGTAVPTSSRVSDPYLDASDYNDINAFRSEPSDWTDAQRDAAILG